ncbi:hypothetical protein ABRQ21_06905 [Latilactobacillus sakei]|uniref:hypothetical protein n=1 Tax=Latilactobacillus sakei TaxID=1599 RepID=UPI0020C7A766|nr:hypothetical protein [Latilactobacillus sakei]MCP8851473.1 hypothetical protein [Latilactobacillus sakei]
MGKKKKIPKNGGSPSKSVKSGSPSNLVNNNLNASTTDVSIELGMYPNWTHSTRVGEFTNEFHDSDEALRYIYLTLDKLLPFIKQNGKEFRSQRLAHCHVLKNDQKVLAFNIIKEIHSDTDISEDSALWELGYGQGVRLIASVIYSDKVQIIPLFLDFHHLLYPSKKYNQNDYSKNACNLSPNELYK